MIGIEGMPRRVADYAEQFATWNSIISIASFILGAEHADLRLQHGRQLAPRAARRGQPVARR